MWAALHFLMMFAVPIFFGALAAIAVGRVARARILRRQSEVSSRGGDSPPSGRAFR